MTMPQTRHYEMKDSGVEWIGEMPRHWNTLRLQKIYRIKKDIAGTAGHTVLSVTQHGIKPKNMDSKGQFALDYSKYQLVKSGDFVMNHMDLLTGWVDISKYDGVTSPDYRVFTSIANCQNTFFKYIFQFCYMNRVFYGLGQGVADVGRWRLPADMFRKFMLPVPPLSEQIAIAAYLDEKCATIDAIIAEAKASIEEYKSWKASVIFETVTKGLNPNAEMKDSGVEWIGKTPEHWTIAKQKYFVTLINGRAYADNEFKSDGKYRVLRVGNFFTNSSWYYSDLELESDKYCDDGDLLYAWSASYGPKIWDGGKVIYHYHIWKCKLGKAVDKMFCYYYYLALGQFVANSAHGTAMMHITMQMMNNAFMPIPPLPEQTAIASYLATKCASIDGVILEKEELIRELETYKKSLIFEVVTGKRRVC